VGLGRMNYKDIETYIRLFFKIVLLTDFAACASRFNRQEIHSLMVGIFIQLVNCYPHGRRNYKDTKPYMPSLLVFNKVYRLEIQSVTLVFSTPLVYCCPSTFSLISPLPPFPKVNIQYSICRQCVAVGGWGLGGVELCCRPYSAGVYHSVSDQIQNLQNCYTTPNKNNQ
jgi:hypothetical protein